MNLTFMQSISKREYLVSSGILGQYGNVGFDPVRAIVKIRSLFGWHRSKSDSTESGSYIYVT